MPTYTIKAENGNFVLYIDGESWGTYESEYKARRDVECYVPQAVEVNEVDN